MIKDDFYTFVNKKWLDETILPADKSRYCTFNILDDKTKDKLKELIENSINQKGTSYEKIGILYNQGLKKTDNYKREIKLINNILNHIDSSESIEKLLDKIINIETKIGITAPFSRYVSSDYVDSNTNVLYLSSSGLGLSREYYIIEKLEYIGKRELYKKFLKEYSDVFNLNIDINKFYDLEKKLAEKTFSKEDKRNIDKINNPMTISEFIILYPKFNFIRRISKKINNNSKIIVDNLDYFKLLNDELLDNNLDIWKQYFKLKFILDMKSYLSEEIYLLYFNFYGIIIHGAKEPEPLWKRSIHLCEDILGELIGELYRKTYFSEDAKHKAEELVEFIKTELSKIIKSNTWMEEITKTKALQKLNKMTTKIGYPNNLERNYNKLKISNEKTYLENMLWANIFLNKYELSYLYEPVNKNKWYLPSYTINAYYAPSLNEIVFPAGILQEPFFSLDQSDEKNFGGIGTVIGHEITHGFDDQGCRFDENGNLNNWWTNIDKQKYSEKTKIIEEQFNEFRIEGNNVNGKLTLGENIADIGGVHIAYKALLSYLKKNNKSKDKIKDFFINFACVWKNKSTCEHIKEALLNDPHAPPIFRVNGVLSNLDEFYKVFNINETDKLFIPENKRSNLWDCY
jgi:endothelin-converting enzyme/putative endopeptidase